MRCFAILALAACAGVIALLDPEGGGFGRAAAEENEPGSVCSRRTPDRTLAPVPCNERLAGDWGGMLTESTGSTYRVEISLQSNGNGTIAYPKLKCSGTLDYLMRRQETYVYRETITEGTECGDTAEVQLTAIAADGAAFDFNWVGEGPTVTGRLTGILVAGATETGGTIAKPGPGNEDECFKYLPNRGTLISTPCGEGTPTN